MSNKTDGKKALEAGEFRTAEQKLLKALDNRPDDGEVWWALMLCKAEVRSDAELAAAVRDSYKRAAEKGGGEPSTPFDTNYCRNALRYETDGKKRAFIKDLYDDLSEIWIRAYGRRVKPPLPRQKKLPDIANIATGIAYTATALMVAGVWLLCFSLLTWKVWALWTGLALFAVFGIGSFIMLRVLKKVGGAADVAAVVLVTAIVLSALALLIVGIFRGYSMVVAMAAVALAIVGAFGLYKLFTRRTAQKQTKTPSRDPSELMRRANNKKEDYKSEKAVNNVYKDEFD